MKKSSLGGLGIGLLVGVALGVAIGILYAPKSGRETRWVLRERASGALAGIQAKIARIGGDGREAATTRYP